MSQLDLEDLVKLVSAIEHQKGKHVKATLLLLEKNDMLTPASRKIILDGFNNFNRQIMRLVGYTVEM